VTTTQLFVSKSKHSLEPRGRHVLSVVSTHIILEGDKVVHCFVKGSAHYDVGVFNTLQAFVIESLQEPTGTGRHEFETGSLHSPVKLTGRHMFVAGSIQSELRLTVNKH
jgi:hypothetical protein